MGLDDFLRGYIEGRAKLRPNTVRNLQQSRRILTEHFGKTCTVGTIRPGDADAFEEIRPYLATAFEQAEDGAVFVIQRYRARNANLRTQLLRIVSKASVSSWPRLFHNLRASRETELATEFPIHVVCEWIGNSVDVARKHYLQFKKSDVKSDVAHARRRRQTENGTAVSPAFAKDTAVQVPPRGNEQGTQNGRETVLARPRDAFSDAPEPGRPQSHVDDDPDLHRVLSAWPDLAPAIRAAVMALVEAAGQPTPRRQVRGSR